jgi:hypothetical protein
MRWVTSCGNQLFEVEGKCEQVNNVKRGKLPFYIYFLKFTEHQVLGDGEDRWAEK